MEITHRTRNLRIAPRKLRLVVDQIRYLDATQAMETLRLTPRKGGLLVSKSLKSAIEVAKDNNLDVSTLTIQQVWCDEGSSLKRVIGHSRGRMARIMKKHSHLSLVLRGNEQSRKRAARPARKAEPAEATETAHQSDSPEVTPEAVITNPTGNVPATEEKE